MTRPELPMDDQTLLAFVDGKLSAADNEAVSRFLAAHPDRAEMVALWQRQNEAIAALNPPLGGAPVPPRLDPHRLAMRRPRADWRQLAAAALLLLGIGVGGGWFGHAALLPEESPSEALIDSAVTAHALYVMEARHAVEVAGSDEEHLVTWLSNRLDTRIGAPDLIAQGFVLVGGRLLPPTEYANAGPAAQLMYENATADRLTVYITASMPERGPNYQVAVRDGLDAFYWADDAITCTVVGKLPAAEMEILARQVYRQLARRS